MITRDEVMKIKAGDLVELNTCILQITFMNISYRSNGNKRINTVQLEDIDHNIHNFKEYDMEHALLNVNQWIKASDICKGCVVLSTCKKNYQILECYHERNKNG